MKIMIAKVIISREDDKKIIYMGYRKLDIEGDNIVVF